MMYEWVSQREKKAAKIGEGVWGEFSEPVLWSKWGEKGMDGDGYEYILTLIEYHKLLHLFNRMTIFPLYLMVVLKTITGLMIQKE